MDDSLFSNEPAPKDDSLFSNEPAPQWSDMGKNIVPDAMNVGKGIMDMGERSIKGVMDLPKDAMTSAAEVAGGASPLNTPLAQNIKTAIIDPIAGIPQQIENLGSKEQWIEHPVGNAMTAGSIVAPMIAPEEGLASKFSEGMENKGGGMASDLAETGAGTVKKISPEMLGEEAKPNIRMVGEKPNLADIRTESGKKLVNEGVVGGMGQDIGDRLQAANEKMDDFGNQVKDSIGKVKSKGIDASVDAKTVLNPLLDKYVKLGDSSVPAMGRPYAELYTRLEKIANQNGGKLSFEDIDKELHDPGLKEAFKKTADSRAYETAKTKYAVLADARDQIVNQIAQQSGDPKIASNLTNANKGYSYYTRIAKDMETPAAGGVTNGAPSPQRAALRGSFVRAGLYSLVQQFKPALAKAMVEGAPAVEKYGSMIEAAAKKGPRNLAMTDFILRQQDPDYAEATK